MSSLLLDGDLACPKDPFICTQRQVASRFLQVNCDLTIRSSGFTSSLWQPWERSPRLFSRSRSGEVCKQIRLPAFLQRICARSLCPVRRNKPPLFLRIFPGQALWNSAAAVLARKWAVPPKGFVSGATTGAQPRSAPLLRNKHPCCCFFTISAPNKRLFFHSCPPVAVKLSGGGGSAFNWSYFLRFYVFQRRRTLACFQK